MAPLPTAPSSPQSNGHGAGSTVAAILGIIAAPAAFLAIQTKQFNVVTYRSETVDVPGYLPPLVFGVVLLALPVATALLASRRQQQVRLFHYICAPLALTVPLAASSFVPPQLQFICVYPFILGLAWSMCRGAAAAFELGIHKKPDWLFVAIIGLAISLLTAIHFRIQQNLFEHFMLGHADIGHYLEEMKNALAGRGLRCDSFANTRLGWHFTPLLYALVPGYALWPSPGYLMALGPALLHLPAFPIYWLARRDASHALPALLLVFAWLLIPSMSRLVYCNTYGFQWLYFSLPFLALAVASFHKERWPLYWGATCIILLTQETNAAIVVGLGLYGLIFSRHRWVGAATMVIAGVYLLCCIQLWIPHFATTHRYERLDLFGELGDSIIDVAFAPFTHPVATLERVTRPEAAHFATLLLVVTALAPLRRWRLLIAAVPTLFLLLLLKNEDWLSIKFWHQATMLPILFAAAALALDGPQTQLRKTLTPIGPEVRPSRTNSLGIAASVLMAAAWWHYFFGFSPISKPYAVYAGESWLHRPDPRHALVEQLRREIPRARTVLATERMAAHFTDYTRVFTGGRPFAADLVIIDRSDSWDTTALPRRAPEFVANPAYRKYAEAGPVLVFQRVGESVDPLPP